MDYRQRIDGLAINNPTHKTKGLKGDNPKEISTQFSTAHQVAEPKDMEDEILSLASDIQKMPSPSLVDKGSMYISTTS